MCLQFWLSLVCVSTVQQLDMQVEARATIPASLKLSVVYPTPAPRPPRRPSAAPLLVTLFIYYHVTLITQLTGYCTQGLSQLELHVQL